MRSRRIISWTLAGAAILLLIAGGGGILFLRSRYFAGYALDKIVESVNQATGGRTEIRDLDFDLSTLTAHLYDVTVHGTEPPDLSPLLHIDKLTVGLKIQSALQRKITLSELLIEHPEVNLRVSSDGKSNLPQIPASQSSSNRSVFDLAVRHALLSRGEISYNDKQTPLDADLHDLGIDVHFDPSTTRYSGSLTYDNGRLRYAQYQPLPHDLTATFKATPSGFSLDSAKLKMANSTLLLRATLANYSHPAVDGTYEIRLHAQDFAAMSPSSAPAGDVSLRGNLRYENSGNQPLLQSLSLDGQIASELLTAVSPDAGLEVRKLQGRYQLAHGSLRADEISAELLGGSLKASLDVQHLDSTPSTNVSALLRGISLRAAQQSIRNPQTRRVAVLGIVDGNAIASWTGNMQNLRAHSDLNLRPSQQSSAAAANADQLPVEGEIHATYDGSRGSLTLRQTTLHTGSSRISAQGEISTGSNLQIQASAGDLHQVVQLASALGAASSKIAGISGSASINATVRGSVHEPHIAGQLAAQNLQVQGSLWASASFAFQANASQFQIQQASLVSAAQGKVSFSGSVGLRNWSYLPSSPIRAHLAAQQMPITDLQRLANLQYPISGDISADLNVTGSQLNPAGSGSAHVSDARAYGEPLQTLAVKFQADRGTIVSTLNVVSPAGTVNGDLSFTPQTKAYTFHLNAPAVVLQKLHTLQAKNVPITGTLNAAAQGKGTLDRPQLTAVIESSQLQVKQNSISELRAEVRVADQRADLFLSSRAAQASIRAQGRVNLDGDYDAEGSVDTTSIPLDLFLATYTSVPDGFRGQTEFHATVKGPLKDRSRLEAHVTIPTFNASYQSLEIAAAGPIRADYIHSVLTLQPAEIRGTGTSLRVQGTIPFEGTSAPTLTANGTVDVGIVRIVVPDVRSSGTIALDVRASGSARNPALQGQVRLQDISFATDAAPLGIENLNGTLDVANDSVQLSSLTGQVGGGQLSAGGSIVFRPGVQFNLALQAKSIRLRYPDGLRMLLDGNLAFSGTPEASTVNGRVLVDSLSFTPDFDLSKFSDQFNGGTVPAQPGFADNIKLAIGVQSKDNLSATSSQISIEGGVNLQVIGTAANPVIIGRTDLTSGELFYRNLRYQLQRGLITFDNPTETEPKMDVSVTTTVEQYNLTVTLRGTLDKLETFYTSDPPLATADVINLIARGQTTQEAAASSQSTDSILASQAASQVSGGLQKLAGLSSLQIDPLIGGNNATASARIALQQRVTKNLLFTFSTDVSQPGSEIVQGEYQINKRWSVSVARDETGGVSVDGRYHTKF
jgi:translocation and assembly module TamB